MLYDKYDEYQSEMELLVSADKARSAIPVKDRETFETFYFKVIAKAREIIKRADGTTSKASRTSVENPNEHNNDNIRDYIKKLNVSVFYGSYKH